MARIRGTSVAPTVLGVVSGVLGLPSAYCSGMCAGLVDAVAESSGLMEFYMYGTIALSLYILVISCFSRKAPIAVGVLMLIASLIALILYVVTANLLGIIAVILSVIGGILSIVQKKEVVE